MFSKYFYVKIETKTEIEYNTTGETVLTKKNVDAGGGWDSKVAWGACTGIHHYSLKCRIWRARCSIDFEIPQLGLYKHWNVHFYKLNMILKIIGQNKSFKSFG